MAVVGQADEVNIGSVEADDRTWNVTVVIENDGVEFVGHLWFADEAWEDEGFRDHGAIPGRSVDEVTEHARALSAQDLMLRFRRAQADQRRHHGLRKLTEQVLENIRHLNKVATSMRAGLLEVDEAAAEIDATEQKLHSMIRELRHFAGVQG